LFWETIKPDSDTKIDVGQQEIVEKSLKERQEAGKRSKRRSSRRSGRRSKIYEEEEDK
jgi:hypothetical protein